MCGYCIKKGKKIDDRKVVEFCLRQRSKLGCINLRFLPDKRKKKGYLGIAVI